MYIDTHCHLNFKDFRADADEVIKKTIAAETQMILVGAEQKTSLRAVEYAKQYPEGVYAAIGLHPIHLEEMHIENDDENGEGEYNFIARAEEFNYDNYEKLAKFEKVVAIGEIGLDYYHLDPTSDLAAVKRKQQEVFIQQLLLARNLNLPAIIHCRQAHDDLLAILTDFKKNYSDLIPSNKPWGVIHCFSGDEDLAWKYFNLGLLISFTGLITFSKQWDDLIRKTPLDKIMIETDAPYMTPEPFRGQRNEPLLVQYVAQRIAEIKNVKFERVAEITFSTAKSFFKL
ncbi:MAG: TatD family hydrolase [Candidatus Falkowbacteria bacterium]|nr:TatD family hydrolase [Candidatus Falkowbacteria bacterium]